MQINFVVHLLPFNFLLIPFIVAVRANVIFISWRVQNVLIDWLIDNYKEECFPVWNLALKGWFINIEYWLIYMWHLS